ncbi:MAG: twin-arginine translocation signal domain-containing protein, partial [Pseudaminobacter sp.]|nr:twin-arginine translocation signal domain-containing protein [Pseudaminobacter sp.]
MINGINRRAFLGTTAIGLGAMAFGTGTLVAQDKV